jgi:hypothetical protein
MSKVKLTIAVASLAASIVIFAAPAGAQDPNKGPIRSARPPFNQHFNQPQYHNNGHQGTYGPHPAPGGPCGIRLPYRRF